MAPDQSEVSRALFSIFLVRQEKKNAWSMICDRGLSLTKTGSKTPRRLSKTEGKLNTKILRYCSNKLMFVVIVAIFNFRHDLALTILLWGIGRDFDIYQKIAVEFPTPGKNLRSNITKFPHPEK